MKCQEDLIKALTDPRIVVKPRSTPDEPSDALVMMVEALTMQVAFGCVLIREEWG